METKSILKPGRYPGVPMRTYHREWTALGSSSLKDLLRSPRHFFRARHSDAAEVWTPAKIRGTILHSILLKQKVEPDLVILPPGLDRRRKADKETYKNLISVALEGALECKYEDYEAMLRVADRVRNSVIYQELVGDLGECDVESSYVFESDGVLQKFRPDVLNANMVDLKSTGVEPWPDAFERGAYSFGYHIQAAHYIAGMVSYLRAEGLDETFRGDFFFLVFEQGGDDPAIAAYRAGEDLLDLGLQCRKEALRVYKECREHGLWPGLNEQIEDGAIVPQLYDVGVPRWARTPDGALYHRIGREVLA